MRKAAIVSGKYGGFRAMLPMIRLFDADPDWKATLYLCDQHIQEPWGYTAREASRLCKNIQLLTPFKNQSQFRVPGLFQSAERLSDILSGSLRPDVVIVYGDRMDALIGATAAHQLNIPVAHLQGGDLSGCIDNQTRFAISCLAKWHFCSTDSAARRLLTILEQFLDPWPYVHTVGDHHIDAVLDAQQNENAFIADSMPSPYYVVHLHPDTLLSASENARMANEVFQELQENGNNLAIMRPCTDNMCKQILAQMPPQSDKVKHFDYLPLEQYVPLLEGSLGLIGNTSACILDAPALGVPSCLIGSRQKGRDGAFLTWQGPLSWFLKDPYAHRTEPSSYFGKGLAGQHTFDVLNAECK